MEKDQMLARIHQLEREVAELKNGVEPADEKRGIIGPARQLGAIVTQHWALFSLLAALATALYVQFAYGVDYFEEYRNIRASKDISAFYQDLGDRMLANQEWAAAEDAYRAALEVNPNNIDATYGIVKAQVFQPLEGQRFYAPEVVRTKLEFLLDKEEFKRDHQVLFLSGVYYMNLRDDPNARDLLAQAAQKNPDFIGSHLAMGYLEARSSNHAQARVHFERVLELDPENAQAHNNLGINYLLQLEFDDSVGYLKRAMQLSPSLLTAMNLGDAYLLQGNFPEARQWHQWAFFVLGEPGIENERFVGGTWLYNFMPLERGDQETIKQWVEVGSLSQKKAILYYRLSFDHAVSGDFNAAEQAFKTAQEQDPSRQYDLYIGCHIESIRNLLVLADEVRDWFDAHRALLPCGLG